jgi:hypothetical protein
MSVFILGSYAFWPGCSRERRKVASEPSVRPSVRPSVQQAAGLTAPYNNAKPSRQKSITFVIIYHGGVNQVGGGQRKRVRGGSYSPDSRLCPLYQCCSSSFAAAGQRRRFPFNSSKENFHFSLRRIPL